MIAGSEPLSETESQSRRQATTSSPSDELPLDFVFTESLVSHRTPVLFSTNRGLHLRRSRLWAPATCPDTTASKYDIQFCDLERWSTRRANTVSLNEESSQNSTNVSNSRVRSVRFETGRGRSQRSFVVSENN